jgi:hypothetical protein
MPREIPVEWEQSTLLPAERVHLRLDVWIVGGEDNIPVTSTLWEGDDQDLLWLHTLNIDLRAGVGVEERYQLLEEVLEARERTTPF